MTAQEPPLVLAQELFLSLYHLVAPTAVRQLDCGALGSRVQVKALVTAGVCVVVVPGLLAL